MARRLGEAFVDIRADASLFRASAITGMKKALAGVDAKIPVTAETARASAKIRAVLHEIAAADPTIDIRIGTDLASAAMASFAARLKALTDNASNLRVGLDDRAALAQLARLQIAIRSLTSSVGSKKFRITPESIAGTEAEVLGLEAAYNRLADAIGKVSIEERNAAERARFLAAMKPRIDAIADKLSHMRADVEDAGFLAKIARMQAALAAFKDKKIDISDAGFARAEAELLGMEAALSVTSEGVKNLNDRLTTGRVRWFGWIGGIFAAKVALFAGTRTVGGFHLALDAAVETLAVLVPALTVLTVGLGAFAAAAFLAQDTAGRIADHLKAVQTASTALGQQIPPLTDNFNKLAGVIRPQVFELYGAAIQAASSQTGFLGKIAEQTGALLDRMVARLVVDLNSGGGGMRSFFKTGEEDLRQLGILFQNIGHIIAQLARVANQTHIAEFLIKGIAGASNALRVIADFPVPLLAVVAALHGIYLWSGIATTLLVKLVLGPARGLANLAAGASAAGVAVKSLAADAGGLTRIKAYLSDIGTGFSALPGRIKGLGGILKNLFSSPWTWAIIGAAVMIGLAVAFITAKDATDHFIDSMNKAVDTATLFTVINTTASSLIQTNQRLAQTQQQVNTEFAKSVNSATVAEGRYAGLAKTYGNTAQDAAKLAAEHAKLSGQLTLETGRLSEVAAKFGTDGLAGAMALATLAGVKVSDLLSKDQKVWATAIQQIQNLVTGYANMGQGAKQFASDLNVLTVAGSDQLKALDQLNSAYDTFTKIVGAPVSNFLSLDQAVTRFNQDAQVAGARMSGLGGGIEVASKKVKTSSVQLQQDFQDVFNSAEQLFDAMRSSQAPADAQVSAIKHAVQALIPLAGSNKAAAAEISALAQEAGGPATTNLQTLAHWAGKTKDPIGALYKDSENAAIGFSDLSLDAQKLGTALSQDLTDDMAKAVENAIGLQGAMNKLALDIQHNTDNTAAGHKDRKQLYDDLVQVTGSGKQANAIIKAMTDRIHGNGDALAATAAARKRFTQDLLDVIHHAPTARDDVQHLADAIKNHGVQSDEARNARLRLLHDLEQSGVNAKDAKRLVDNLQTSINALHGKVVTIQMVGTGDYTIRQAALSSSSNRNNGAGGPNAVSKGAASGLYITQGTGPKADDVPVWVSKGEYVVQASAVNEYGLPFLNALNARTLRGKNFQRRANGGVVESFPRLDGFGGRMEGTEVRDMENTMVPLMRAALKAAEAKAAMAIAGVIGNYHPGAGVDQWRNATLSALSMAGASTSLVNAVLYQMQTESGGNPRAVNLWDSNAAAGHPSVGLMQVIGPTYAAYGAPREGYPPPVAYGVSEAPVANIYSAIKYAQVAYGPDLRNIRGGIGSGHGYAAGGPVHGYAGGGVPTFLDPKAAAWLKRYNAAQKAEYKDYVGFTQAWRKDLKHPKAGSYAASHTKTLLSELGTLDKRQRAEDAAYDAILHMGVTAKTTGHLGSLIREELTTSRDKSLAYQGKGGGHSGWLSGMRYWLGQINSLITHTPAANILPAGVVTEKVPGSVKDIHLGPVHSVPGGVLTFDQGGYLPPGLTVAYNGTGKPEQVVPGGGGSVTVVIENNGVIGSQQEMDTWLQTSMNRLARSGKLTQAVNAATRRR